MGKTTNTPKPKCFIIMPISVPDHLLETYGSDKHHFNDVLKHLFEPAVELAGFDPIPPSSDGSRVIHRDIAEKLHSAEMVLCDMSALNPNVFFELGIRTAMDKPVCLVRDSALTKPPFDTGLIQCHPYNSTPGWGLDAQRKGTRRTYHRHCQDQGIHGRQKRLVAGHGYQLRPCLYHLRRRPPRFDAT